MSDGKTLEHREHGLTMHIFAVSAAMLGVCHTAIDIAYAIVQHGPRRCEAFKGTLVVLAGLGGLSLIHHDAQRLAEELVGHLHLNPAKHYPRIFIDTAAHLTDTRLWVLAALATTYGLVRFVEAYGLWQGKRWAEWFAAVSAGIYIPFELYGLFEGDTWFSLAALVINVFIVGLMVSALLRKHPVEANAA